MQGQRSSIMVKFCLGACPQQNLLKQSRLGTKKMLFKNQAKSGLPRYSVV
jgi:hypothetical protein